MKHGKRAKEGNIILKLKKLQPPILNLKMFRPEKQEKLEELSESKESKIKVQISKILKSKIIWIRVGIAIFLSLIISFSAYKITYTEEYANKKMTKLVTEYYEKNIKENVAGLGRLIVTLQTLQDAGYNIKGIKGKPGVSEDLSKAFSYVIIENPEETSEKIIYIIENHLNGE